MLVEDHPAESAAAAPPSPPAVEVCGLSKRFCRDLKRSLLYGMQDIGREILGRPQRIGQLKKNEFWALQNLDLDLPRGTALGLVGRNGSGKTTLMRTLAGLIKPTIGQVTVRGRLAPLLALGAGFNPVLTGRENIYTNMLILGLTKAEIDERFERVVQFSEVEYALDAPVQTYSSGMAARLGFACAIHTDPDVLLVDEVLAVGDLKFRQKCITALMERREMGMSLILVHHSPNVILATCDQALYLEEGLNLAFGPTAEVIDKYERGLNLATSLRPRKLSPATGRIPAKQDPFRCDEAEIVDVQIGVPAPVAVAYLGDPLDIKIAFDLREIPPAFRLQAKFFRMSDIDVVAENADPKTILRINCSFREKNLPLPVPGANEVCLRLPGLVLGPGYYQVQVDALSRTDYIASMTSPRFRVDSRNEHFKGDFYQPYQWLPRPEPAPPVPPFSAGDIEGEEIGNEEEPGEPENGNDERPTG